MQSVPRFYAYGADLSRTEKICLAITPSLKAYGISGRARLFEIVQRAKEINQERFRKGIQGGFIQKDENWKYSFITSSFIANALAEDPSLELDYFVTPHRMKLYVEIQYQGFSIYSMSLYDFAVRFSVFDALAGYSDVITEEARPTNCEIVLDENAIQLLNRSFL